MVNKQILNLSPATDYQWQVRSVCSNDSITNSSWSVSEVFTTWTPCATPTNASTINVGITFATVTVGIPLLIHGDIGLGIKRLVILLVHLCMILFLIILIQFLV